MIFKDYIRSAVLTFLAGVLIVVVPQLESLTIEDLTNGTLVGILFAGVRTGLKMALEMYLVWYQSRSK